jgi:undecaprenyl-diphosphatase
MIDYKQAVLLGVIQGLTEFIPISSTAHLRVVPALMNEEDPGAAYSAVIQLGTLISLLIYFRADLISFFRASYMGIVRGEPLQSRDSRMLYYMALGTLPISVAGLLFAKFITGEARSLYVISVTLIALAGILWLSDRFSRKVETLERLDWRHALYIGIAQSFALIPGASRAGTTLTMGLMLGYTREAAMRISFLLSIPAIALSGVYELFEERDHLAFLGFEGLLLGTAVSALVGYGTIAGLLRYLRTRSTAIFVIYRIVLGFVILILLDKNLVQPF